MNKKIVGESGAGLVKITLNYLGKAIQVEIDDLIFKETDKQLVSDLFVAALNNVFEKYDTIIKEQIAKTYGIGKNTSLPPLMPGTNGFKNQRCKMIIDVFVFGAVMLLWVTKFSAKKRLLASTIVVGYCIHTGLYAHVNDDTGFAVLFLIGGIINAFVAYTWLGRAYPDRRLTDGKNDSV